VVPQGGNVRVLSTLEFQFPIAKTFFGIGFRWVGALFWDMGAIIDSPELVRGSDFKHSLGISLLRILTPVGPLSLEYAIPLTQSFAEERWKSNPWYSHFPGKIHFNWGIPLSRL
jgi:outer membrane protein assembly factor BamA